MEFREIRIERPEGANVIIGQAHFIKTIDDLYEAVAAATGGTARFGIAFNEASGKRLVRVAGNDAALMDCAVRNAKEVGAGHAFFIVMGSGYPIQVLPQIRAVPEVCRIFCATANPLQVIVAENQQGRGIVAVIDGEPPVDVESAEDIAERRSLLKRLGYTASLPTIPS
ncbi:MAG: adenosine-specific kinase [Firmicutes bacterium]|nr:adenosine-specific kinase [Bacillota bacterium]